MVKSRKDRNLIQRDGKWYLDFTFNKKRIREFAGFTKEQAKCNLIKRKSDLLDERRGYKKAKIEDVGFMDFAGEFIELYSKQNKRSWSRDESSLRALRPYFKTMTIQQVRPEIIERYRAKRKAEVAPGTINREIAFMKTMFNKAVEWGRLESSPLLKVKNLREPNYKAKILSTLESKRLVDKASDRLRPILIVALNTGMRKGEIFALRWENADLMKRRIHVEDSKSGKSRYIPMNDAIVEALSVIPQDNEFVFYHSSTGKPLKSVKNSFKTALKRAEIKCRFHDLRHTAATHMVEIGVDLMTVSRILGHASIQMTMRYAHPTPENMRLAVEKLDEFYKQTRQKVDTIEIKKPASRFMSDS